MALAQAFSQPGMRPRRSLLFLATSGGAAGKLAWGSNAYFDRFHSGPHRQELVGAINLDMIGHLPAGDSLTIDGLADVEMEQRPAWLAAAHPELGLVIADGGTAVRPTSDQFAFARGNVPSLWIHTGVHPAVPPGRYPGLPLDGAPETRTDVRTPGGNLTGAIPDAVASDETARILRFVFYLSESIANAERGMRWSVEGRRRFLEVTVP